jgi:hypothetical protein
MKKKRIKTVTVIPVPLSAEEKSKVLAALTRYFSKPDRCTSKKEK